MNPLSNVQHSLSFHILLTVFLACDAPEEMDSTPSTAVASLATAAPIADATPPKISSVTAKIPDFPKTGMVLTKALGVEECLKTFDRCKCSKTSSISACFPHFRMESFPLDQEIRTAMTGKSWREGCPMPLSDLRLVRLLHWTPEESVQWGETIVDHQVVEDIEAIFSDLYAAKFPIHSMIPIHKFDGDDGKSMEANNSSSFNCRTVGGTPTWSEHSYGRAIDLNPFWNPWVRDQKVDPPSAVAYRDRSDIRTGMITENGNVTKAFSSRGWKWGGLWSRANDYQHFSKSGR
jgi:hypothetical protein